MKPITLKLTAFGPYKDTEIIDFRKLEDRKLYVISGNTGAGKTTIFDGICFALFGSASGSERNENQFLRSDFAEDTIHTSAELVFELNGRTYRILRQPGHIKKGNKTKTGESYEFFEITEAGERPVVDRQIVSEIDRKVETIIGLSQDQFKQIVMLPQGEFRKLLTSETANKENILRSLFKTAKYNDLNEIIQKRSQQAKEAFEQAQYNEQHFVQSLSSALPEREGSALTDALAADYKHSGHIAEGLSSEIDYYKQQIDRESREYEKSSADLSKQREDFFSAKRLNEQFAEKESKQIELAELESEKPAYDRLDQQLQRAEQAAEIEWQENQELQLRDDLKEKETKLEQARSKHDKAKAMLAAASEQLEIEQRKEEERQSASEEAIRLRELLPSIEKLQASRKEQKQLEMKQNETAARLEKERQTKEKNSVALEQLNKAIRELEQASDKLPEKKNKCDELRKHVVTIKNYSKLYKEHGSALKAANDEAAAYENARKSYEKTEQAWLDGQAAILADHLHDGEACPVCGSAEHPNKANSSAAGVSRQTLNESKKQLDTRQRSYEDAKIVLQSKAAVLEAAVEELKAAGISEAETDSKYKDLIEEGKPLAEEIKMLEQQHAMLPDKRLQYDQSNTQNKAHAEYCNELERKFYEYKSANETALNSYNQNLERIPEHLREPGKLEERLKQAEQKVARLKQSYDKANRKSETAKAEMAGRLAERNSAQSNYEEAKAKLLKAAEQFAASLADKGFESAESYRHAKMSSSDRTLQKNRLEAYRQQILTLHSRIAELTATLEGKEIQPLVQMQERIGLLEEANERAFQQLNSTKQYLKTAEEFQKELANVGSRIQRLEKEYTVVKSLHDTLRGQNNRKISFERYLQIEYLEQIIEAANERLHELSNGQFRLMHSERQESRGKASGLGLDVYDAYTGQTRDVKTLSGGEKFNASLCLALGMSDVIQSFQGNVSIETMFIDEGFGSLDEESLHKAIDTLIGLQKSGRMIGVISHVGELKAMFPATLEVKKTKEGFSKTKFIIK